MHDEAGPGAFDPSNLNEPAAPPAAFHNIALLPGKTGGNNIVNLAGDTAQTAGQIVSLDADSSALLLQQAQKRIRDLFCDPHEASSF